MLDNYKSVPLMACVFGLLLIPVGIVALTFASLRSDYTDQSQEKTEESSATGSSFGGASTKSSKQFSFPSSEPAGGGGEIDPNTGIPTGTYSNPPTTVETGSETVVPPRKSSPSTADFSSSVERNRSIQQSLNSGSANNSLSDFGGSAESSIDNSLPDYNSPAPSNNYNNSQDNSLIKPLEENTLLESPTTSRETVPLAPVGKPLSEPLNSDL
jgi:hypothetical protein